VVDGAVVGEDEAGELDGAVVEPVATRLVVVADATTVVPGVDAVVVVGDVLEVDPHAATVTAPTAPRSTRTDRTTLDESCIRTNVTTVNQPGVRRVQSVGKHPRVSFGRPVRSRSTLAEFAVADCHRPP
jgi:hypothetical protein